MEGKDFLLPCIGTEARLALSMTVGCNAGEEHGSDTKAESGGLVTHAHICLCTSIHKHVTGDKKERQDKEKNEKLSLIHI